MFGQHTHRYSKIFFYQLTSRDWLVKDRHYQQRSHWWDCLNCSMLSVTRRGRDSNECTLISQGSRSSWLSTTCFKPWFHFIKHSTNALMWKHFSYSLLYLLVLKWKRFVFRTTSPCLSLSVKKKKLWHTEV